MAVNGAVTFRASGSSGGSPAGTGRCSGRRRRRRCAGRQRIGGCRKLARSLCRIPNCIAGPVEPEWQCADSAGVRLCGVRFRLPYRPTNRVDQLTRWKWLAQIRNATGQSGLPLDAFTVDCGHEYDWKLGSAGRKAVRQFDAGDATQIDIQKEAACLGRGSVLEECLGRCIGLGEESVRAQ